MKRLPVVGGAAVVAAGALAALPAVLGLAGNPSFSQHVPVRPPQHARVVVLQDSAASHTVPARIPVHRTPAPAVPTRSGGSDDRSAESRSDAVARHDTREAEPGDDHGRRQEDESVKEDQGNDRNGADDRGGRVGGHSSEDG